MHQKRQMRSKLRTQYFADESISRFFKSIEVQREAYQPGLGYIARRQGEQFVISQASVRIGTGPSEVPPSHFQSENIRAGYYNLAELELSIEDVLAQLLSGSIQTPHGKLHFPSSMAGNYPISFEPFHSAGIANQSRLNVLRIEGAQQNLNQQIESFNWELRGARSPYDNVQELMNEYKLGLLRPDHISVEFVAFNVAVVEFASKVEGSKAFPRMRLAHGLDFKLATLGYRAVMRGNVLSRGSISGEDLIWKNEEAYKVGEGELDIPVNSALQCFASYAGTVQHFGWLADPMASQNPRRAAYEAFDPELSTLKDIFAKAQGRGPQTKDFEAGLAWLFWMLGFSVAHLGGVPRTQDAADLILVTPKGGFAIIECTTGLLKAENKMALLNDRLQAVRKKLDGADSSHIRILPVMITSKSKEEVKADLDQAEKLEILVLTKDDFDEAITRTLVLPDADIFLDEGFKAVARAKAKHVLASA